MPHPPKPPPDVARLRRLMTAGRILIHDHHHLYTWLTPEELPQPAPHPRPLLLDTDPPPAYDAHEAPE